jgi:hypothetical protein
MPLRGWKNYERQVMRQFLQERPHVAIEWDAKVSEVTGQYNRQIDVWLPDTREIVECKHHADPVDIGVVDQLVGVARDVNASTAYLFSSSGFRPNALIRAEKERINCMHLPFARKFEEPLRATGGGYYSGEYFEMCLCSTPTSPAGDTYGRISYFDGRGDFWPVCVSLSVDWTDIKTRRFVAYILLTHKLGEPPSDASINDFVNCYGDHLETGQEWNIHEEEVGSIAEAESICC